MLTESSFGTNSSVLTAHPYRLILMRTVKTRKVRNPSLINNLQETRIHEQGEKRSPKLAITSVVRNRSLRQS